VTGVAGIRKRREGDRYGSITITLFFLKMEATPFA
jgi:hypothetical protein